MSVTFGFFNSIASDRKYDAEDMGRLFDGLIRDGIFMSIGTAMVVNATTNMIVNVGVGRAWFDHTWTLNDSVLQLTVSVSEVLLNRIDAIVLEVNSTTSIRTNSIKIVKGTPASTPVNPTMTKTGLVHQYPLCYISVAAGVTSITQANITNKVGTSDCPFVTGILSTVNIDALVAQWGVDWTNWKTVKDGNFTTWFNTVKAQIGTDLGTSLQMQINATQTYEQAAGTATAITLTNVYTTDRAAKSFKATTDNNGAATTINAKPVYKEGTTSAPTIKAGKHYIVVYSTSSNCFFLRASAEGTAIVGNVLAGKTFSNDTDTGIIGTMNEYAAMNLFMANHGSGMTAVVDPSDNRMGILTLPNVDYGGGYNGHISNTTKFQAQLWGLIPSAIAAGAVIGQYPGYGAGGMTGTFSADANIEPHLMIAPYSAYKNGTKVVGTMPSMGGEEYAGWRRATVFQAPNPGRVHLRIPLGGYLVGTSSQEGQLGVFADDPEFISANILNTANIFGIQGTAIAGKRYASGGPVLTGGHRAFDYGDRSTGSPAVYMDTITVSGLTFKPSMIVVRSSPYQNFRYTTVYTKNPVSPGMQTILACSVDYYGSGTGTKWFQIYDGDYQYAWEGGDRVAYVNTSGFRLPMLAVASRYDCTWEAYE